MGKKTDSLNASLNDSSTGRQKIWTARTETLLIIFHQKRSLFSASSTVFASLSPPLFLSLLRRKIQTYMDTVKALSTTLHALLHAPTQPLRRNPFTPAAALHRSHKKHLWSNDLIVIIVQEHRRRLVVITAEDLSTKKNRAKVTLFLFRATHSPIIDWIHWPLSSSTTFIGSTRHNKFSARPQKQRYTMPTTDQTSCIQLRCRETLCPRSTGKTNDFQLDYIFFKGLLQHLWRKVSAW